LSGEADWEVAENHQLRMRVTLVNGSLMEVSCWKSQAFYVLTAL
jgi:hypothetical protein